MSEVILARYGSGDADSAPVPFKLNSRELVENASKQPYVASRNAIAKALRRKLATPSAVIYIDYRIKHDWGYSSALEALVRVSDDEIALGCQHFVGEETRKLKAWALGGDRG